MYDQIDDLIITGKIVEAREALSAALDSPSDNKPDAKLAAFCWRVGQPEKGLRLLQKKVRPKGKYVDKATPEEVAEYAQCLMRVGARDEGKKLLESLNPETVPKTLFYLAGYYVSGWDYPASIPLLEKYLKSKNLPAYQAIVGKVNLAAGYIWDGRKNTVMPLLRNLVHDCSMRNYRLLLARSLELTAEAFLSTNDWKNARLSLDEAEKRIGGTVGEGLFIRKYQLAVDYLSTKGKAEKKALQKFRDEMTKARAWETVRDCDRLLALGEHDQALFEKVYFGTPYPKYRERFLHDFGKSPSPATNYLWNISGKKKAPVFEIELQRFAGKDLSEPLEGVLRTLFVTLASDFYRPLRLADLHFHVYPDSHFNYLSSPRAVHETVRRLRQWLSGQRIPLEIQEDQETYRLVATDPISIATSLDYRFVDRDETFLGQLRDQFGEKDFSVGDVETSLELPRRTIQRFLQEGIDAGNLSRAGKSSATRYRVLKKAG